MFEANRNLPRWCDTPRHCSSGVGVGIRPIGENEVLAVDVMKTYGREFGGTTPRILNAGSSDSCVCPYISLYTGVGVDGKISHCPLNRRLGGSWSLCESFGEEVNKSLTPTENPSRIPRTSGP